VEVESVVADSPCYSALFAGCRSLVGLTFDAQIHDMVSADSTVVDDDIPGPQSYGIPLLHLKSLLAVAALLWLETRLLRVSRRSRRSIGHVDVRHDLFLKKVAKETMCMEG